MAAKKIIIDWSETGKTVYAMVRREADGYRLDDGDGTFGAAPADPYLSLAEDATIKGRYEASEGRTVWTGGRYTIAVYKQAGGSPAPASDTIIGTGEMKVESDAEVTEITLSEIEGSGVLAKQAKLDFVEKWILNRLVESADGTSVTLYDDDNVTPLKTWAYNATTKTRNKAV
ncbi:MAG: hypothetical protein Q8P48_04875 [Deltaproteobacteria bacterium]|nr:hypothetical protein [Deltaproteobacteria bacterium]